MQQGGGGAGGKGAYVEGQDGEAAAARLHYRPRTTYVPSLHILLERAPTSSPHETRRPALRNGKRSSVTKLSLTLMAVPHPLHVVSGNVLMEPSPSTTFMWALVNA